jgi:hypothetical protein
MNSAPPAPGHHVGLVRTRDEAMADEHQLDEALSFEGLRALAMHIVKDIDARTPPTRFNGLDSRAKYLHATIDVMHRALIAAHEEMAKEGVPPRRLMEELAELGHELADAEVTMLKAFERKRSVRR